MNNQLTLFDRDSDYLESSVKDFDSKTASFRVHASLIYKLGESLIADEITALSELIKNAYDADATVCALSISSDASVAGKSAHINVALKEYKTAQGLIADAPFIPLETVSKIDEIYGYIQAASDDYPVLCSKLF